MSANVPMPLPECSAHGQMELQAPGTPEQEWCGIWYHCRVCKSGALFPSPALERASNGHQQPNDRS